MIRFVQATSGTLPEKMIKNPTLDDVIACVHLLDGEEYSVVTLGSDPDEPPWLQVCGGDNGNVMCQYMWNLLDGFKILKNPKGSPTEEASLTIGGQTTDRWSMDGLHSPHDLHSCLRYFCETGKMNPDLEWE